MIASGPTVPDPTTAADAEAILARYGIELPDSVRRHLESPAAETPKPGDPRLARAETRLIAAPQLSLEAAAKPARAEGVTPVLLGDGFRCVGWLQASSGPLPSDQTARPNTWWTRARCAGMSLAGTARTCPLASIAIASTPASVRRAVPKL